MSSYIIAPAGILILAALIFGAVSLGGSSLVPQLSGISSEEGTTSSNSNADLVGRDALYFDLPDTAGNRVKLSDFVDTPLLIVFWATWSSEASDQMHILDQYLSEEGNQLVQIVAIDTQEEKSVVSSFMRRGGYTVPVLTDVQGATAAEYDVKSLPMLYFIGRDGVIQDAYAGVMSQRMLVDKLEKISQ